MVSGLIYSMRSFLLRSTLIMTISRKSESVRAKLFGICLSGLHVQVHRLHKVISSYSLICSTSKGAQPWLVGYTQTNPIPISEQDRRPQKRAFRTERTQILAWTRTVCQRRGIQSKKTLWSSQQRYPCYLSGFSVTFFATRCSSVFSHRVTSGNTTAESRNNELPFFKKS